MASLDGTYGIADAVTLFSEQSSSIVNLWTVFVVATFSAAGFGATEKLTNYQKSGVTIGFLAFAIGHMSLLVVCINLQRALSADIMHNIADHTKDFSASLKQLAGHPSNIKIASFFHIIIDICVVVIIWFRPRQTATRGK